MDNSPPLPAGQKKGLSGLAWLGIGCGGLIVLAIVGFAIVAFFFGSKVKDFTTEAAKNPTKAAASMMVSMGVGEIVAEDDVNKRYTVREKQSGKLTTFYWDAKANGPKSVPGDFSAIPADVSAPEPGVKEPATPVPAGK